MSAAGIGFKPAGDSSGMNGPAASFGPHVAVHAIDLNIAGASVGAHCVADIGNPQAAGSSPHFDRLANTFHRLIAGTGL